MCDSNICQEHLTNIKDIVGDDRFNMILPNLKALIDTNKPNEKKKRTKHVIPLNERCLAKKCGGSQCTRRKRNDSPFCGTHIKGTPHGKILDVCNNMKKIQVFAEEVKGIVYFIDEDGNVYDSEDIFQQLENPRVVSKYKREGGNILFMD